MRTRILLGAILLVLAAASIAEAKDRDRPVELVFHPDREELAEKAGDLLPYELKGDTVIFNLNGVAMQIRPLTEAGRSTFYQLRSRIRTDPFPPLAKYPTGFLVFEISFLNSTNEQFQFLPGMASIIRGREGKGNKEIFPMGIGDFYGYFSALFNGDELKIKLAIEPVYYQTVYLAPGERTTKLLIFDGLSKRTRRIGLNLDFLFLGSDTQNVMIPYRVQAVER
jgi:hypothetical protein